MAQGLSTRWVSGLVFVAYVAFATMVAGAAAPGAGMAVLVVGLFAALLIEHARWQVEDAHRTGLSAPFRPDPHGVIRRRSGEAEPPRRRRTVTVATAPTDAANTDLPPA